MPEVASWLGTPHIKGSSESMRMALLSFSLIGLQFTWGIEMTYCTPYLLQLGLTKSRTSLVWIAGPLSGLVMQPVVGVIADRSKSKWGRRRPFMIGGSLIVAVSLLVLGWTSEIVAWFISDPDTRKSATIALAVFSIYAVDFAINAVQASCRSLIVDTLPIPKQQLGSAWASRMIGIGHLLGYIAGTVDLIGIFGTRLGDTQFKQLTVVAASSLLVAVSVTSYAVKERILISARDSESRSGAVKMVAQILKTTLHLPDRIQAICWIQFWAWIGWFPFLFYSTTWVGETYFRYDAPKDAQQSSDMLGEIGRVGSLSLVVFSVISFAGSVTLPWVVKAPENENTPFTPRPPPSIGPLVSEMAKYKPDLLTAWMISHLIFAAAMILAPFVTSLRFATTIVSVCGIPWALACWAPFAFMGVEINRVSASTSSSYHRLSDTTPASPIELEEGVPQHHHLIPTVPESPTVLRITHNTDPAPSSAASSATAAPSNSTGELAGIYLGILNLYTTLPQFLGTFISMIVFSVLEPGKSPELAIDVDDAAAAHDTGGEEGVNGIAVCLFIGALSALGAAWATYRLRKRGI